jgi:atypical dual specificity phosphatase
MYKIFQHLYMGNHVDLYSTLIDIAPNRLVGAIIDCTSDLPSSKWHRDKTLPLKKVGIQENVTITRLQIKKALQFIKEQHKQSRPVLVACKTGKTRSATVIASYLIIYKDMTPEQALEKIQSIVPDATISVDNMKVLSKIAAELEVMV